MAFSPFRPVGCICGSLPADFTLLYEKPTLMVPVGRTFLVYSGLEMNLVRGGPNFEDEVTCVAHSGKYRYVAEGGNVHAFSHHKPLWSKLHSQVKLPVRHMIAADELLFTVGADNKVKVWEHRSGEEFNSFLLPANCGQVTALQLAPGYNNKLLVATTSGKIFLYNFRSAQLLFTIGGEGPESDYTAITCLAVHPHHRDIIAFGCANGSIVVMDYREAREVAVFNHTEGSPSALAFRLDDDGVLFSATSGGEVALWDLKEKQLLGIISKTKQVRSRDDVLENAHTDKVHTLVSVPGQPLLISCATDNAMCQYRLDTVDGMALMIRERRGHTGQCTQARFYNADLVLTAGVEDQALRCTHVFSDRASWEMSQGKFGRRARDQQVTTAALRMPPATMLDSTPARNYQWASIVSLHQSSASIGCWRLDNRCLASRTAPLRTGVQCCRCLSISACGNFVMVGFSSGHLTKVNLQDYSHKHFFPRLGSTAHTASVEGVEVTAGNTAVLSFGLDRKAKKWSLADGTLISETTLPSAPCCTFVHPNGLVGVALIDFTIRVYDATNDSLPCVRVFSGHEAPVKAIALTPDSNRHIVSASSDAKILLWDLALGHCVGAYVLPSPVSSIAFHPDALFMITTHIGERGAFLWTNNLRYGFAPEVADPTSPVPLSLPNTVAEDTAGEEDDVELFNENDDVALMAAKRTQLELQKLNEIHPDGLSFSGRRFKELTSLHFQEQIREKNQPLLPPKKEKAPFFLETTKELKPTFIVKPSTDGDQQSGKNNTALDREDRSLKALVAAEEFEKGLQLLIAASIPSMDLEIRDLLRSEDAVDEAIDAVSPADVRLSLQFLKYCVGQKNSCDVVQHFTAHFLNVHANQLLSAVSKDSSLVEDLQQLMEEQERMRVTIGALTDYSMCLSSTFANSFA